MISPFGLQFCRLLDLRCVFATTATTRSAVAPPRAAASPKSAEHQHLAVLALGATTTTTASGAKCKGNLRWESPLRQQALGYWSPLQGRKVLKGKACEALNAALHATQSRNIEDRAFTTCTLERDCFRKASLTRLVSPFKNSFECERREQDCVILLTT